MFLYLPLRGVWGRADPSVCPRKEVQYGANRIVMFKCLTCGTKGQIAVAFRVAMYKISKFVISIFDLPWTPMLTSLLLPFLIGSDKSWSHCISVQLSPSNRLSQCLPCQLSADHLMLPKMFLKKCLCFYAFLDYFVHILLVFLKSWDFRFSPTCSLDLCALLRCYAAYIGTCLPTFGTAHQWDSSSWIAHPWTRNRQAVSKRQYKY